MSLVRADPDDRGDALAEPQQCGGDRGLRGTAAARFRGNEDERRAAPAYMEQLNGGYGVVLYGERES